MNAAGPTASPLSVSPTRLALACGILALVMIAVWCALAAWANVQNGTAGLASASTAVAVCWFSATAALAVSSLVANTPLAIHGTLACIFLRTLLPMAIGLVLHQKVPYLADAGVFVLLLFAYLPALAAETLLSLWFVAPTRSLAKAP